LKTEPLRSGCHPRRGFSVRRFVRHTGRAPSCRLGQREPERAGRCQPSASPIVPSVRQQHSTRPPPAIPARPRVGRGPVCSRACSRRIRPSVPLPQPKRAASRDRSLVEDLGALTGCCCALLRPGAPPRALDSQPHLEAPGCNPRVLGLLLHLFISRSWTARSSVLRWPFFNGRVCRAVPRVRNGQAVVSSIAEALVTNGCWLQENGRMLILGKGTCTRRSKADPSKRQEPSWKRDRKERWRGHTPTITDVQPGFPM
jgi:hypothetical protein